MATQLSVHNVTRITARKPNEFLPQKRGEEGFWSRTLLLWQGSEIVEVLVFGATEASLMLPGEKPAERRLDEYALQARKPYTSPVLTEYTLPPTDGGVDLASEAAKLLPAICPHCSAEQDTVAGRVVCRDCARVFTACND